MLAERVRQRAGFRSHFSRVPTAVIIAVLVWLLSRGAAIAEPIPPTAPFPTAIAEPTPSAAPFPTSLPGQNPTSQRMRIGRQEALEIALLNSPTLLSGLAQIRSARLNIQLQKIPMRTTFTLLNDVTRVVTPGSQVSDNSLNSYALALNINQTISTFGRVKWGVLQARLTEKQIAQDYRTAVEVLLQNVDTLYIKSILALELVRVADTLRIGRKKFLETSLMLFKMGVAAEYDVLQYHSALTQAEQTLQAAQNNAQQSRVLLLTQLGIRPDMPVDLVYQNLPVAPPPDGIEDGMARALRQRPELAALRWAVHAAEAQAQVAARTNTPTLGLQTTYQGLNDTNGSPDNEWTAGMTLSYLFGDGGQARLLRNVARETLVSTKQSLESSRRTVEQDVASAYADLVSLWQQKATAETNVGQAREALKIAELRYREGVSGSVELLSSQQAYGTTMETFADVIASYHVALVNWRRAISGEWPVQLPPSLQVDWETPLPLPEESPKGPMENP